ncbi:MAG: hypothetical protein EOP84_23235 [Verrucomicrobiaceae bacterium]|nr:MAG: hypothetical protein EOP84_23235 [Verrucomicrobiaceae bacterium]
MDPSTPPESDNELPSDEEFEAWLRAHPENLDYFMELIARTEKGEFGEVPADMREITRMVLAKHQDSERLRVVQRQMQDLVTELQRVMDNSATPEAMQSLCRRCDGVIDAALDLPEPHRAGVMQELLPLRDGLRAIGDPAD